MLCDIRRRYFSTFVFFTFVFFYFHNKLFYLVIHHNRFKIQCSYIELLFRVIHQKIILILLVTFSIFMKSKKLKLLFFFVSKSF